MCYNEFMTSQVTEKIKLWGIVQGVGFRPYVAKMADRMGMKGEVLNIGGLVEITVTDEPSRIDEFVDALVREKPGPSEIVHIRRQVLEYAEFDGFSIVRSDEGDDEAAMIPADLAICPHCLEELYDEQNPRYRHPFISCQLCGPRYTVIDRIPYDRHNTTMIDFPMCDFCEGEYTDIRDRRHHAQTISCHDCGPKLIWKRAGAQGVTAGAQGAATGGSVVGGNVEADAAILDEVAEVLRGGGVIAFKAVGGYNLVADPFSEQGVTKLREIKNRESKPFAVMFRSLEEIGKYCSVSDVEASLLQSSARPILLLEHKLNEMSAAELAAARDADNGAGAWTDDLKRSRFIGSFLPSLGAQYLLLDRISPLIFTSANLSDMPMIKDDEEFFEMAGADGVAGGAEGVQGLCKVDGVLYNTRRINVRMDDSVARVIDGQPQMIRRSKGYAPVPLYVSAGSGLSKFSILATGGQLKNSFALTKGPFAYVSQYFGDMDSLENQAIYEENIDRMAELFRIKPDAVVCDMHPLYQPRFFGEKYAAEHGRGAAGEGSTVLPVLYVQHHHAHVASVMAEHDIDGPVIGVAFDGTGYGTDGAIWGGEFLLCEGGEFERKAHLKYVNMIGGDSSMKDARRSALSYIAEMRQRGQSPLSQNGKVEDTQDVDISHEIAVDISDIIEFGRERLLEGPDSELIMKALDAGINSIRSSSMGRLFDAVSALLGIKDYNDYEGQCAIMLEDAAAFAQKHPGEDKAGDLALSFHNRIIDMIVEQCEKIRDEAGEPVNKVALTGGTFQNRILTEGVLAKLRARGFEPYYNVSVSPNDGGIALGQAFIGMHRLR